MTAETTTPRLPARGDGNRVSHHEPNYKSKSLAQQYDNIEEAIGWMVPSLLTLLPIGEGFETIFARGPVALKG